MFHRGLTTHGKITYRADLEEGFVYIPLKDKSDSDEESETSSSGESAHSEEQESQD